ncbi:MAG: hypothetical protein ABSA47_06220 [Verrucomicrobiota bacterium]|jgi:hypothetical protein
MRPIRPIRPIPDVRLIPPPPRLARNWQNFDVCNPLPFLIISPHSDENNATNYADGTVWGIGGTAAHGKSYIYGAGTDINGNTCTYTTETDLNSAGAPTSEFTTTYTDMAGRTTESFYGDGS